MVAKKLWSVAVTAQCRWLQKAHFPHSSMPIKGASSQPVKV